MSKRSGSKRKLDVDDQRETKKRKVEKEYIDHPKWKYLTISEDDYYKYHTEFTDWALNKQCKYLDEMSTKKCKKLYKKFMKKWNAGKLEEKYYKGISSLSINNHQKTRYKWSFESNINEKEQTKLDLIKDEIDNETNEQVIADRIAQRFLRKFEQKRNRNKDRNKHKHKNHNHNNDDIEFENDNDGMDTHQKIEKQHKDRKDRLEQKRKDRKHRIKEMKNQRDKQYLSSYQSFISSETKKKRK